MRYKGLTIAPLLLLGTALSGCLPTKETPIDRLAQKASEAAERAAAATVEPWEIKNIAARRILMGKPGLIFYVVFFNDMGQPIDYFTSGKCTSSNKRLTPDEHFVQGARNGFTGDILVSAPGEDGTYGKSDDYIYCFTVDGKYKQWNGDYYASDHPLELTIKPLIVSISGKGEVAKNQSQQ